MPNFDKFRRLIPEKILKKIQKINQKYEPVKEYDIVGNFKYLDNTSRYFEANIYTKIWYLRGKFNWFIDLSKRNAMIADAHIEMLKEIESELLRLAYQQKDMDAFVAIFNLSSSVVAFYERYVNGVEITDNSKSSESEIDSSLIEDLWLMRELYDESKEQLNFDCMMDICKGVKVLAKRVKGPDELEDYNAVLDIHKKIKDEIFYLKSVEREK